VHAQGSINISTSNSSGAASSLAGTGLSGNLDVSFGPSGLSFDFAATGQVVFDNFQIASVNANLKSTPTGVSLSLAGTASLPTVGSSGGSGSSTVNLSGSVAMGDGSGAIAAGCNDPGGDQGTDSSGSLAFCLYANIPAPGLALFGSHLTGTFLVDNQGVDITGTMFGLTVQAGFNTDGTMWASTLGPQSINILGVSLSNAQVGFCAGTNCQADANEATGFWVDGSFSTGGFSFSLNASYTSFSDYSLTATLTGLGGSSSVPFAVVILGATISYAASVTITQNGVSNVTLTGADGTGEATAEAWDETWGITGGSFPFYSYGWSGENDLGGIGVSLSKGQACATVSAVSQTATVCS
jgi:hypothetical protein